MIALHIQTWRNIWRTHPFEIWSVQNATTDQRFFPI